ELQSILVIRGAGWPHMVLVRINGRLPIWLNVHPDSEKYIGVPQMTSPVLREQHRILPRGISVIEFFAHDLNEVILHLAILRQAGGQKTTFQTQPEPGVGGSRTG